MNIALFGCTDKTLHAARYLSKLGLQIDLITISPITAVANKVAGLSTTKLGAGVSMPFFENLT